MSPAPAVWRHIRAAAALWHKSRLVILVMMLLWLPLDHTTAGEPILFDPAERGRQLKAMPDAQRILLCDSERQSWRSYRAITTVRDTPEYGIDERAEPFAMTVMDASAEAFGLDNDVAQDHLVRLLDRWADGRAFTKLRPPTETAHYTVERSLLPTIIAFWLVQDAPEMTAERYRRIDAWLDGLVERSLERRRQFDPESRVARNNHNYLNASVIMAWASFKGDLERLQVGVDAFRDAVGAMRADGSLPLETDRGARALWYQRHAITSLVTIAEIAAVNGIDLYELETNGRSLHRAITFLLDGIDDPDIVRAYAAANVSPGPDTDPDEQDLGFLEERGHGRHYMAWAEPYMHRFPDHPNARRLAARLLANGDTRPMVDDYNGGNMSCFFADPPISESSTR